MSHLKHIKFFHLAWIKQYCSSISVILFKHVFKLEPCFLCVLTMTCDGGKTCLTCLLRWPQSDHTWNAGCSGMTGSAGPTDTQCDSSGHHQWYLTKTGNGTSEKTGNETIYQETELRKWYTRKGIKNLMSEFVIPFKDAMLSFKTKPKLKLDVPTFLISLNPRLTQSHVD